MTDTITLTTPTGTPFPIGNLPLGIGRVGDRPASAWVALGDHAVDLAGLQRTGRLDGTGAPDAVFAEESLNRFLATGPEIWAAVRARLTELLTAPVAAEHVVRRAELRMGVPVRPTDFVDFYSSLHHATNLGRLFRPDSEPLLPNWRHLPVGYHGRTGTLVADGTTVPRPAGLRSIDGEPVAGPSRALDFELEVGTVIGVGSRLGEPVPIDRADAHLYGLCLVNDWSARDLQAFEYQPLGPFLGKSFATSVSPWLIGFAALEPHRVAPPDQHPEPAAYLRTDQPWGFDLWLEVALQSADMSAPVTISTARFADMYWTPAQQLAHLTVNGASVAPGDLFASGTVSGPGEGTEGSLIEMTDNGRRPLDLPDGTCRTFLEDGDRVVLRGWAGGPDDPRRVGLGEVSGTVAATRGD